MERYREIIDDWEDFRRECQERDELVTVRKNPLKAGESFEADLREEFGEVTESGWNQKVFRLGRDLSPGRSVLHWRGEYYVQEESASLPVEVLDPQPGETVLDMCAAPGGKTTQMAAEIENQGTVYANDSNENRLKSLYANIYRTGSACTAVTNYDGRNLPESREYDRILVDAPCSGEGNNARRSFESSEETERESLSNLQLDLLEKASRLVKAGGEIVYSTCTFAPEENESVIEEVLERTELELKKVETDAEHSRGVKEFEDRRYSFDTEKTIRIYPHHLGSGGIFVARLRKPE